MNWWVLELITFGGLVLALVALGPLIKRFGRSYAADVFRANPRTGKSYIVLMDIAYYLIFSAYILFTTVFEQQDAWAQTVGAAQLRHEALRIGGMLLIIQPGAGGISSALVFALAGSLITAAIQLILKRMSLHDTTDRLVAWNLLFMVPLAMVPAFVFWTTPSLVQLALLITQGMLGALNMTLVTRALSLAEVSFIAPLDFLRLPLVATLAYLMFGEIPELSTWVGAAVIFGATLLVAGGTRFIHRDQTDIQ